jgi:hypothetical protein
MSVNWTNLGNYTFGCSSNDGTKVYCYNQNVLYRSLNGGISFTTVLTLSGTYGNITCVACSGDGTKLILGCQFCNTSSDLGVYYSTNNGTNWNLLSDLDLNLYAGNWYSASVSTDGSQFAIGQYPSDSYLPFNGNNPLIYGDGGLIASGLFVYSLSVLSNINNSICATKTTIISGNTIPSSIIYLGNDQSSIGDTDQNGYEWIKAVQSDDTIYIYGIRQNSNTLYVYQNINSVYSLAYTTSVGSSSLTDVYCSNDGLYVVVCSSGGYIYTSINRGVSFTQRENVNMWSKNFVSNNGQVLYASNSSSLYQSTDGGVSCILYNTKILLSNNTEELIQNLKIGDYVKTTEGNKKIIYIGWNETNDLVNSFKVIKKDSIELNIPNYDLYLSNGHSIFFNENEYKDEYYVKNYDDVNFYNTSQKFEGYKRILMMDFIYSSTIQNNDENKFYHIVLENDDKNKQYIIFTNNIMSETMSENFIKHSRLNKI